MHRYSIHLLRGFSIFFLLLLHGYTAQAIWVVNFGAANTLAPRRIGFAAGMGGQMVFVGSPRTTSAFFTIPHAGFRYGLAKKQI